MIDAVLDVLAERSPRLSEIVTGAPDPASPASPDVPLWKSGQRNSSHRPGSSRAAFRLGTIVVARLKNTALAGRLHVESTLAGWAPAAPNYGSRLRADAETRSVRGVKTMARRLGAHRRSIRFLPLDTKALIGTPASKSRRSGGCSGRIPVEYRANTRR
jgi:hypothetical protein